MSDLKLKIKLFILPLLLLVCSCENNTTSSNHKTVEQSVYNHPNIASLTKDIGSHPKEAHLYFERGQRLQDMGQDSLALHDYLQAIKLDSTKSNYMSAAGSLLFDKKDITASLPWFQKAMKLNPNDPQVHLSIAKIFIFTQSYKEAFEEINTVLKQDVYNPEAYFLKGIAYKELKDTTRALSSFLTSVQVDPGFGKGMVQIAQIHASNGDTIAYTYYENAFHTDTTNVFPLYAKAMMMQEQKLYERAKTEYAKCIYYDNSYVDAYFNTGFILMHQDSLEKAARQFDLVSKLDPTNGSAFYNQGLCFEMMGKKTEALQLYEQALVFDAENPNITKAIERIEKK